MNDFVAHWSRWRLARLILLGVGFVLLGLWMIGAFGAPPTSRNYPPDLVLFMGWAGIIFFGLCCVVIVSRFFSKREQLRIGPAGIRYAVRSDQTIPWREIVGIGTWNSAGQKSIILHLRDPASFPARGIASIFAGANRKITGGDVSISLTGTDSEFDDAMSAIARFQPVEPENNRA